MIFAILFLAAVVSAKPDADCDARYAELVEPSMALDYPHFDQTGGSGFRVLAEAGCPRQAADLIERYQAHNGAKQRSLIWHVAQLRGESGQTNEALAAARASLNSSEAQDADFRWNAHVRAYLAFLDADRAAFDAALAELDAHLQAHQGNAMNAGFWRKLEPYFDQRYAEATRLGIGGAED